MNTLSVFIIKCTFALCRWLNILSFISTEVPCFSYFLWLRSTGCTHDRDYTLCMSERQEKNRRIFGSIANFACFLLILCYHQHLTFFPYSCELLFFLVGYKTEKLCPTDRTSTGFRISSIFGYGISRVLHDALFFALDTICLNLFSSIFHCVLLHSYILILSSIRRYCKPWILPLQKLCCKLGGWFLMEP